MDQRPSLTIAATEGAAGVVSLVPSPADLFGPLFERVQLEKVFADGKTFADAVPRTAAAAILVAYQREKPETRDALRAFVDHHFDLTPAVTGPASGRRRAAATG